MCISFEHEDEKAKFSIIYLQIALCKNFETYEIRKIREFDGWTVGNAYSQNSRYVNHGGGRLRDAGAQRLIIGRLSNHDGDAEENVD